MRRLLLAAVLLGATSSCWAERVCVSPDCLHVEAKGQTALTLKVWVPPTTRRFTLGVMDQTDDEAVGKPSGFSLRAPDGQTTRRLDQPVVGAWSDYPVDTGGQWGVWTLAVSGPTPPPPAAGKAPANPRNAFVVRTSGEVDLYFQSDAAAPRLMLSPPRFGAAGPHRLWLQAPPGDEVHLTWRRSAGEGTTVALAAPKDATAKWTGLPRGGVESLVVSGPHDGGVWPLSIDQVKAPYRVATVGGLPLFCAAAPLRPARTVALRTLVGGQPGPARVSFAAEAGRAERVVVFTTADGRGQADLVAGVAYTAVATHGLEYGRSEQALDLKAKELALDVPRVVVRPKGWYCGDSHSHSIYSDGSDTPRQVLRAARAEGLDYCFLTDHGTGTDLPHIAQAHAELAALGTPGRFLALPGTEYTLRDYHCNVLGEMFPCPADQPLQAMLDAALARHSVDHPVAVHLNHPTWSGTAKAPALARELQRLPLIELFNGPEPGGIQLWWELLNRGMRVAALTNTDSHNRLGAPLGARRTYVYLGDEPLTLANVLAAVRAGRSYLSTGALLDVTVNGARPGATITPGDLTVQAHVQSGTPVERIELVVNGKVVRKLPGFDGTSLKATLYGPGEPGWAVVQAMAKDNPTPLALTNPVYIAK